MSGYTVIGAAGFVGSHVVAHLRARGIEPFCPRRDDPGLWDRDLGHILYCAGLTGDYRTRPFDTIEAHVALPARLIEQARFDRIVYLSSTRLYDLLPDGAGREDRAIPVNANNPEHLYELSKLLGENLTLHRSDGRGVVARLSYVFGWGEAAQGFLANWLHMARDARQLVLDSGPGVARDYIHVEDAAAAAVALADSRQTGIVNVARGETLSNADIGVVFRARGWDIDFTREGSGANRPVAIDTSRLAALGAAARPVLPLIGDYLAGLG
ncbi:SDR family oxidoreductase [Sphingomonadaceae bacterium G21617-S1]|nr:SDR family oxidoreductase [Sphingomonadaceae bacterium G21617-S1]